MLSCNVTRARIVKMLMHKRPILLALIRQPGQRQYPRRLQLQRQLKWSDLVRWVFSKIEFVEIIIFLSETIPTLSSSVVPTTVPPPTNPATPPTNPQLPVLTPPTVNLNAAADEVSWIILNLKKISKKFTTWLSSFNKRRQTLDNKIFKRQLIPMLLVL